MILVGDFVPQKTSPDLPDWGDEIILANLEGPLCSDGLRPIDKVGIHLHSAPRRFQGRWAFTLANNHFMDYREEGMCETIRLLDGQAIPHTGAGRTLEEARAPMWLEECGKKIAVIGCCEHQFGVADQKNGGVAAIGDWVVDAIHSVREQGADVVIVSCHMGSESSKYVSPRQVELYHHYIDAGADIVHGHHAHIPQGWETYKGKPIFYGLGNFVIDESGWKHNEHHLWSLIVKLDLTENQPRWAVEKFGRVPTSADYYLNEANDIFLDANHLCKKWLENARVQYPKYYKPFLELSFRSIAFLLVHPKRYCLITKNFKKCETHQDIIKTYKSIIKGEN